MSTIKYEDLTVSPSRLLMQVHQFKRVFTKGMSSNENQSRLYDLLLGVQRQMCLPNIGRTPKSVQYKEARVFLKSLIKTLDEAAERGLFND